MLTLRQAIDADINGVMPANVVDKEKTFMAQVADKPDVVRFYQVLSNHYKGMFSPAQILAIHLAATTSSDNKFPRTVSNLKHYTAMVPADKRDLLKYILAEIAATIEAEKMPVPQAKPPTDKPAMVTPQPSQVQMCSRIQAKKRSQI